MFAATTTGLPERRSRSAMSRSCWVSPARASTRNTTTSALGDRLARLLRHLVQDAVLGDGLEPAGVDGQERALADAAAPVVAVARETREIGDERRAAARQSIEERRLADVRASDDHEGRQHGGCLCDGCAAETRGVTRREAATRSPGALRTLRPVNKP